MTESLCKTSCNNFIDLSIPASLKHIVQQVELEKVRRSHLFVVCLIINFTFRLTNYIVVMTTVTVAAITVEITVIYRI